jgi:hypothetical protein
MANTTRALFYVTDVLFRPAPDGTIASHVVTLNAAYDPDPESPNHAFWQATPAGQITMTINNPEVFGLFLPGKKFWLDFTPVKG